ncbi:MAG: GNAT family N-acetyltransferase [Rickettsiaceae bacterium]|nr:GNAT family N-acetyltransferase [Rickettsiaceae bacterium]
MEDEITFVTEFASKSEDRTEGEKFLRQGLNKFNYPFLGEHGSKLSIFAKRDEVIIGGAYSEKCSDAFYLRLLWIDDNYRTQGIGKKLLSLLDEEAHKEGIRKIFVDTYQFQAKEFYEKLEYKVIATVPEYILGYDRFFFRKDL